MYDELQMLAQLDNETWLSFKNVIIEYRLKKDDFILRPSQICRHIFFVQEGLLRSFEIRDGNEYSLAFASEFSFITDVKSLRTEHPAELIIQALEPSVVLAISKVDLSELCQRSHQLETFSRARLAYLLEKQEEYASWFRLYSAKERYGLFVQKNQLLSQRLSLSHLATFLGIRRETLSRIRRLR